MDIRRILDDTRRRASNARKIALDAWRSAENKKVRDIRAKIAAARLFAKRPFDAAWLIPPRLLRRMPLA
jgi:hypothetical protein